MKIWKINPGCVFHNDHGFGFYIVVNDVITATSDYRESAQAAKQRMRDYVKNLRKYYGLSD